jgi:hypothetical protein
MTQNTRQITAWLAAGESATLEFKKSTAGKLLREHESRPWNPLIAQAFYRRGIIET